jgi:alpha-amylase
LICNENVCYILFTQQCVGNAIITDPSFEDHRWFTPAPGESGYISSFQHHHVLAAHAHLTYSSDRQSVKVEILADHRDGAAMTYSVGGAAGQSSNVYSFSAAAGDHGPLAVTVFGADGTQIQLDPIDFVWDTPEVHPLEESTGDYRNGQKGAIVELFMWPHTDVAKECEMLSKMGYMGVKLFPAQEQIMSFETFSNDLNPWYFAYQPVSYRLQGRMGSRDDLRTAISTCRKLGVRVYADAVINHMTGGGNDANPNHRNPNANCSPWGIKNSSLTINSVGTASAAGPSPMYTQSYVYTEGTYTGKPPSQEFPAAHLGPTDFHCERPLNSWTDPLMLNAGWLSGLVDINTEKETVQDRIADYLTDLISIGFSGNRVDAAKHIAPDDIVAIYTKFRNNLGGKLPADYISWLEILLGGESDLLMCNPSSGYNYGLYLEQAFAAAGWDSEDIQKIKIWNSGYPKEPEKGYGCGTISPTRNAVQNDDHDQQTSGSTSRDMGDQGCVLIENCTPDTHRNFELKLFQSPNGASDNSNDYPIRLILSSFYWQGSSFGVPDGLSDCSKCTSGCTSCRTTTAHAAYDASSCGYDSEAYTRPHRDIQIVNAMRSWMKLSNISTAELGLSC